MRKPFIKLTIEWFEKYGEKFIDQEEIVSVTNDRLCDLLNLDKKQYPFIGGCYPVKEEDICKIQPILKHQLDFAKFEYFIGSYQI